MGNTIDGNIFNKHNDQEKKTLVKRINLFNSNFSVLISSCNFDVEFEIIPSVFMYAMNIQNYVIAIGLVLRENCKSKQMTDIIA